MIVPLDQDVVVSYLPRWLLIQTFDFELSSDAVINRFNEWGFSVKAISANVASLNLMMTAKTVDCV